MELPADFLSLGRGSVRYDTIFNFVQSTASLTFIGIPIYL